jgi:predicted ArsR family transcriptional regulator
MDAGKAEAGTLDHLPIPLDRDVFLRSLVRELAGTLEGIVGEQEASGYISVVGAAIGEQIEAEYRRALGVDRLTRAQVTQVLVDLKRRIEGDFYVVSESDDAIVLGNRRCPFGDKVVGRSSMCMMTSNVFGHIAAENLGYAKVELLETIAKGHAACRVVVHLAPVAAAETTRGRVYVRSEASL